MSATTPSISPPAPSPGRAPRAARTPSRPSSDRRAPSDRLRLRGEPARLRALRGALGDGELAWTCVRAGALGHLFVATGRDGLRRVHLSARRPDAGALLAPVAGPGAAARQDDTLLAPFADALLAFLRRPGLDLPLPVDAAGTAFQVAAWRELARVPAGRTVGYGELARRIGRPRAARAIGAACGANPVPFVVPCHRVIAGDGGLGGFGLGADLKRRLLAGEGAWPRR